MSSLIILEFNEINPELFDRMLLAGELPSFAKLSKKTVRLKTTVKENYKNLEPWIQWVTAHTGKTQEEHKAFNLSDVQHSQLLQVWDVLERQGLPCGIVSPMNARRGDLKKGFFIPDPWSVSNDTFPPELAPIYEFLRERIQSHNVTLEKGSSRLRFAMACLKAGVSLPALGRVAFAYLNSRIKPRRRWRLAAELDRFLFELTVTLQKQKKTLFNSVFFNAVAHYQHHYWTEHDREYWGSRYPKLFSKENRIAQKNLEAGDDPIAYGMKIYDIILGRAMSVFGEDSVIVATGLSQIPFEGYRGDSGFYLYRPYDHEKLFAGLGVRFTRCSPLMSRDVMLYFKDDAARSDALAILKDSNVNGAKLFLYTEETDSRLFCKVDYSFDVLDSAYIEAPGLPLRAMRFNDYFQLITFKTGHHSPEGFIMAPSRAFDSDEIAAGTLPLQSIPSIVFKLMKLDNSKLVNTLLEDGGTAVRYDVGFGKVEAA